MTTKTSATKRRAEREPRRRSQPSSAKETATRSDAGDNRSDHGPTFRDRLSNLTYQQMCRLLGPQAKEFLQLAGSYDQVDPESDVRLDDHAARIYLPGDGVVGRDVVVTLTESSSKTRAIEYQCSQCFGTCKHAAAALSLVLEEKVALGLAAPPDAQFLEAESEEQLVDQALEERAKRAREEKFRLQSTDTTRPWTDYTVTSAASGKSYRLALRGEERGQSYCSCPDFRTNTLGTCKHILYALTRVRQKFSAAARRKPYENKHAFVHVDYGDDVTLHLHLPARPSDELRRAVGRFADGPIDDLRGLVRLLGRLEQAGHSIQVYPDAEELIEQRLFQQRVASRMDDIIAQSATHPLRSDLLAVELLPYQLEGIAFAVKAGRAVLADDMGLGKTIQAIGVAEMLAREARIRRVLVICPTSLKSQWRSEVRRFSDRSVQLVVGGAADRPAQYVNDSFFTVCNYEQVLRDILAIERASWDLIILDEGQRIKNWETKTSRVVKSLRSRFALVLTGTPLENRLDDLYSVMQFIDQRRLAPAFRFFHRHRVVDEKGKVLGYKNLDELREALRPVLLRRTRDGVLDQLPPRTTEIVRVPPTDEQVELHNSHMRIVSQIVRKPVLNEMDLLRLQKALLMCRMVANSTFLVDKQPPGYSTKLDHLEELLGQLLDDPSRKVVLFSEWTTMLDLIEPILTNARADFVRLDGSVPQKKRPALVEAFQKRSDCRLFLTTNAGSTGLNLQSANTVVNVDMPWNPAVLEQRIARAHRMGQKHPVHVYALVTEQTIEENLLATLAAKQNLALAVLDPDSDVCEVDFTSGLEELKKRLEVLLGKPVAPVDETSLEQARAGIPGTDEHRARVAEAGGEMLGTVFKFLGELVTAGEAHEPPQQLVHSVRNRLAECVQPDASGRPSLTLTLPDQKTLDDLAGTMARLLAVGGRGE